MEFVEHLKSAAFDNLSIDGHIEDLQGWMDGEFSLVVTEPRLCSSSKWGRGRVCRV